MAGRAREASGKCWRQDWKGVKRAIRGLVDRLKHRREPWRTSSEPDLKWVVVERDTGEQARAVEQVADAGKRPGQELVEWERVNAFKAYLGTDSQAKELVDCYCGNVTSRKEIGKLTGLGWREVNNARKRLRAKWVGFTKWE